MRMTPSNWAEAAAALASVLQAENQALLASDFAAAAALLPAKRAAIQSFESLQPDGPKQGFSDIIGQLDRLSAENRRLLTRSIGIQSQVIGIIASAARTAFAVGYGSTGKSAIRGGALTLSAKA